MSKDYYLTSDHLLVTNGAMDREHDYGYERPTDESVPEFIARMCSIIQEDNPVESPQQEFDDEPGNFMMPSQLQSILDHELVKAPAASGGMVDDGAVWYRSY